MQLSLSENYDYQLVFKENIDELFISLSIGGSFQKSLIKEFSVLSIKDKSNSYLLYNAGNLCQKIAKFILKSKIKKVVLFGSNDAGYATIIWAHLLCRFLHKYDIYIGFISINPNFKINTTTFPKSILLGTKNYLNFEEFFNHYNRYPMQGFIYLPINNQDKYFINHSNIRVFHTDYLEKDINYFVRNSISCSINFLDIIKKQYASTGRKPWQENSERFLSQNIPTLQSLLKYFSDENCQENGFLTKGCFDISIFEDKKIIVFISQISQIINAIYWIKKYKNKENVLLIVEYTRHNINTPQMIFDHYLSIKDDFSNLDLMFLEIPLSNKINYLAFYFFEIKYRNLLNKFNHDLVVMNSMIHRSAVLGWVAKETSKVYLIEEGLGTYLQIDKIRKARQIGYNPLFCNDIDYTQCALIWNFGTKVMQKSILGFLDFDKYYLAFTEIMKGSKNTQYFNPVKTYVEQNINNQEAKYEIVSTIQAMTLGSDFILYIDQNVGFETNIFYEKIIKQLIIDYPKEKILFIMHPKNQHNKHAILYLANQMNVSDRVFLLDFGGKYKAELIISLSNPASVCSLHSSTLIYCKTLGYQGRIVSIALPIIETTKEINNVTAHKNLIEATKPLKLVDGYATRANKIEFVL